MAGAEMPDSPERHVLVVGNGRYPDYEKYCLSQGVAVSYMKLPELDDCLRSAELSTRLSAFSDFVSFNDTCLASVETAKKISGLSYQPIEAVETLTNKSRFKLLRSVKKHSAPYIDLDLNISTAVLEREIEKSIGYPCVIKPNNGFYSAGVVKVQAPGELGSAHRKARTVALALNAIKRNGGILVERYIDGEETAVDGFVVDGIYRAVLVHRKYPELTGPFFHEIAAFSEVIGESDLREEKSIVSEVLNELGLDRCPVHAEFRYDRQGRVYLLEMAPRLGGAGASTNNLLEICSGYSAYALMHDLAGGRKMPMKFADLGCVGVEYDFYARAPGRLRDVDQIVDACYSLGATNVLLNRCDGEYVQPPPDNLDTIATAYFRCESVPDAQQLYEKVSQDVFVQTVS